MESAESFWRVGGRFLRLVLVLDAVILAGAVGLTLLDGSTNAAAIERGTWIVCLTIAMLWPLYLMASNGFAQLLPGGQFGPLLYDVRQYRMSPETSFEMTWLTITILVTLSLVALSLRAVFL